LFRKADKSTEKSSFSSRLSKQPTDGRTLRRDKVGELGLVETLRLELGLALALELGLALALELGLGLELELVELGRDRENKEGMRVGEGVVVAGVRVRGRG
jgi:hypothetical protein